MKKVLISLLLVAILMVTASFAIDSSTYVFYRIGTSSWTVVGTGTPQVVKPFNTWTCQADAVSTTALTLKVVGNLVGSNYATNTPIATTTCNADDVTYSDICIFHWTSKPVLSMRLDVTDFSGVAASSTEKITCLGITE